MKAAERNFIRFTRSSIIVYQPVVRELALADLQLVHAGSYPGKWNWFIAFFPDSMATDRFLLYNKACRLHRVNPQAETLYAANYTPLTGDFVLTREVETFNDLLYYKLKKIEDDILVNCRNKRT